MFDNNTEVNIYHNAVNDLSEGLLHLYRPALKNVQSQLRELTTKQNMMISQIHQENLDLAEVQFASEIEETFNKMNVYYNKLVNIKKDMKHLHERSVKLKKRALKLKQVKEKERLIKLQMEIEIKREAELIGPGPSNVDNKVEL